MPEIQSLSHERTHSHETERSLKRLLPRLEARFAVQIAADPAAWEVFNRRLEANFLDLFRLYFQLYSSHYDFFYHLEDLLTSLAQMWFVRPLDLKDLDARREADPRWFNSVARIAAPALLFKSEAIVHPDDVAKYISPSACQISYNPLLMALLWNSLATRNVRLLNQALRERFKLDQRCAWVNYVRCHDDIGWTFSDEDAARLGVNGFDHRRFLNMFYTGRFEGSFARGLPFQENPKTGDARISGTCASLAGLEKALKEETEREVEHAIRRILLIHGIILTVGGIPLIYLGDEIGTVNDYTCRDDPAKAKDSRWVHRPFFAWEKASLRDEPITIEGRIYQGLSRLIELRKGHPIFAGGEKI